VGLLFAQQLLAIPPEKNEETIWCLDIPSTNCKKDWKKNAKLCPANI